MWFLALCLASFASLAVAVDEGFLLGSGIYDITGPAANVNLMGYAQSTQTAAGIHIRLRSRSFIFAEPSAPSNRVVYVAMDTGMAGWLVKNYVIKKLAADYGDLYTHDNVCLSGSHTHSTPAGFLSYVLYDVTSFGFVREAFDALVEGMYQSIVRAHESVQPGSISINQGQMNNASINRSPTSYLLNPEAERKMYPGDTDNDMVVLRMKNSAGEDISMLNWFAVHGTSMNNTNRLLSGDNKGYASILFEQWKNGNETRPGKGAFVAGFGQSNLGDISPNTAGPHCLDTGLPCALEQSTCNGRNEMCVASGPGKDMFESCKIIGQRQFERTKELYTAATTKLTGRVSWRHMYVDMSNVNVPFGNGTVKTCSAAMGDAFAAGTTDGKGAFNFKQGTTSPNPFWNLVGGILSKPSEEQKKCQAPKPILLNTGEIDFPYPWDPSIVPLQVFKVGSLVIVAPPGEFTTMAGRRLKNLVKDVFGDDVTVVIAGLSNMYTGYITTYEEYQAQRYEAGSTIYGPHTHAAYMQEFKKLAEAIRDDTPVEAGPTPPDLLKKQIELLPGVIEDSVPLGKNFGDVQDDVVSSYVVGETATATFYSGCPRNDLFTEKTFLTVEMQNSSGDWEVILEDGDWDTRFLWGRPSLVSGESIATIVWNIGETNPVRPGTYRLRHFGVSKGLLGKKEAYSGSSSPFKVSAAA